MHETNATATFAFPQLVHSRDVHGNQTTTQYEAYGYESQTTAAFAIPFQNVAVVCVWSSLFIISARESNHSKICSQEIIMLLLLDSGTHLKAIRNAQHRFGYVL